MPPISRMAPPSWPDRLKRFDRVVIAIVVVLAVIFIISPEHGLETVLFALGNLFQIAPFVLFSVGIAAYAHASGADSLIAKAFEGRTLRMVLTAALFGALSPFCSCGVIPIIAALLSMGVPLAPVMAFWLASPVMDPSMFLLTSSVLGLDYAIAKTLAAIGLGLFGGFGILWLGRLGLFSRPLRDGVSNGGCAASSVRTPTPVVWSFWRENDRIVKFRKSGLATLVFLGKWLTFAFILEKLMLIYVPADMITTLLGGDGLAPIGIATLVGIPAYLNGFAALPLVSGLVDQGMQPGAAIAFMIAGSVTSIPAAIAVFALVKHRVFFAYLVFALLGSFAAGLLFQGFVTVT